jgi:hypothetical protein
VAAARIERIDPCVVHRDIERSVNTSVETGAVEHGHPNVSQCEYEQLALLMVSVLAFVRALIFDGLSSNVPFWSLTNEKPFCPLTRRVLGALDPER